MRRPSAEHSAAAPFELAGLAISMTLPGCLITRCYTVLLLGSKLSRVKSPTISLGLKTCTMYPLLKVAGTADRCTLILCLFRACTPTCLLRGWWCLVTLTCFRTPTWSAIVSTIGAGSLNIPRSMLLTWKCMWSILCCGLRRTLEVCRLHVHRSS